MVDKSGRKLNLSIKAKEIDEEKQAMKDYGSSDSGASLGDILGAALQSKLQTEETDNDDDDDDNDDAEAEETAEADDVAADKTES